MKRNLLILIAAALTAAIIVALVMRREVKAPTPVAMTEVLVAARDVAAGENLKQSDFGFQSWPTDAVPAGAVRRGSPEYDAVAGTRLRRGVLKGEPILEATLVQKAGGSFLAGSLQDGMRAVSIPVTAESSVGGFVRPGDRVDVILTYELRIDGGNGSDVSNARKVAERYAGESVLLDVKVLAVDQEVRDVGKDAKPGRTVTLEVDPAQAEKLALAGRMGELSLSLRGLAAGRDLRSGRFTVDLEVAKALDLASRASRTTDSNETVRVYHGATAGRYTISPVRSNGKPSEQTPLTSGMRPSNYIEGKAL